MRWLAVLLFVATRVAHAEPATDLISRPLVLAPHQIAAELVTEINLEPGLVGRPLSLAPDLWVGVLPRLTVGLIHSDLSVDRIAPGASVCVRRDGFLCDAIYRGGGLDVIYSAVAGAFEVAPRARVLVRDLDPVKPALTIGAALKWRRGRFAIAGDPYLQVGLANTERGNRSALWLPVAFEVQPTCRWMLELDTGWNSDLAVLRDGWHVPVAAGVRARATAHVDVAASFGFTSLLGPQNTPKERVIFVAVGWR